jgi:hypothetical protein
MGGKELKPFEPLLLELNIGLGSNYRQLTPRENVLSGRVSNGLARRCIGTKKQPNLQEGNANEGRREVIETQRVVGHPFFGSWVVAMLCGLFTVGCVAFVVVWIDGGRYARKRQKEERRERDRWPIPPFRQ